MDDDNDMFEMMTFKQNNREPMLKFHERFKNMVDAIEGQWGESHPTKVAENNGKCSGEKTKLEQKCCGHFWHVHFCTV